MQVKPTIAHINLAHGFRGGERQTELLVKALADNYQLKQMLLCREDSPLIEHLQTLPVEIIPLKNKPDARLSGHLRLAARAQLLHAHEARAAQWVYLHSLLFKTPYIITRRVPEPIRDNAFNRAINGKAAALVAISQAIAQGLEQQFKRSIEIIPSVNAGFAPNAEHSAQLQAQYAENFIIGQVGALVDRHKGQSVTLKAAALLKVKIPKLKVLFLGSGEDEATLQELAHDLEVDAEFLGFKQNVADYLPCFDVFAFPSNYEGLGSVLLDVMAAQVPIVASEVGGIPDIVKDEYSGLLIKSQDSAALAEQIQRVHSDAALRGKLIQGGLAVAATHSPEHMAESYLSLYLDVLPGLKAEDSYR